MKPPLNVAIVGAGMGGLAVAASLRKAGIDVTVYEQARQFTRLGAGIQIGCNAMHVLRGLGLEQRLRAETFYPRSWNNRDWRTGEVLFDMMFGRRPRTNTVRRICWPIAAICMRRWRAWCRPTASGSTTGWSASSRQMAACGSPSPTATASRPTPWSAPTASTRSYAPALFGEVEPHFTGRIAYRTVYPARLLTAEGGFDIGDCTKWWGEDRHIVMYPVKPDRSEVYFVTSQPEPGFNLESWSAKGDVDVLRAAFEGFHPDVPRVLAACPDVHKRPLVDREPLEHWVEGNVALLGDACHPMTPYMAQGAAMAIEDAAILSRCLDGASARASPPALPRVRSDPPATNREDAAHLTRKPLGKGRHRPRLGLRLQRLDCAAGGLNRSNEIHDPK